jgi:capsular polysaccharide transport system permease protein
MVGFLATGIVSYTLFRETAARCMSAINANKALLYYPQVRPLDLVAARALLETTTQLTVMGLLMGGLALYEGQFNIDSVLQIALGLGLAAGLGVSLGLVLCGLSVFNRGVERLAPALMRPIFWLSSIFHTVESVPKGFRDILLLNPVTHALELVRDGWFPGYYARHADPWYPAAWILVLSFFGLSLERVARRSIELV